MSRSTACISPCLLRLTRCLPAPLPGCLLFAECLITPAPADSLMAGASTSSSSSSLRRKACKDVTSGEAEAHWQLYLPSGLCCLCTQTPGLGWQLELEGWRCQLH